MKKVKESSITKKMTFALSVIIVIEIILLTAIFLLGGVSRKIKENSFKSFTKTVESEKLIIQNYMDTVWNKTNSLYYYVLNELNTSYQNSMDLYYAEQNEQVAFVDKVAAGLMNTIDSTYICGAFIIIENGRSKISGTAYNEGLYIVDTDLINNYNFKLDFESKIGGDNVLSELELSSSIDHKSNFGFLYDNNYYNNYVKEVNSSLTKGLYNFFHWSTYYRDDDQIMVLTIPLITDNSVCVGVIGTEVSLSNFKTFNSINNVDTPKNNSYLIGILDDKNTIRLSHSKELFITDYFPATIDKRVSFDNNNVFNNIFYINSTPKNNDLGSVQKIDLYQSDSYFETQNWVIVGFNSLSNLTENAQYVENILVLNIIITFLFGLIVLYICIKYIANPIKRLSYQVKTNPINEMNLDKSNIIEINDLIGSIEKLSMDVIQYSKKLSNAIDIFSLGIFFYQDDSTKVYCTQPFYDICGINKKEGYVDKPEFEVLLETITCSEYDYKYSAYRLNDVKWIKIVTKKESSFNLGIVTDVTHQIDEIRKIEKERDIDPLTKLYNRNAFNKAAEEIFKNSNSKVIAIIMWDIDKLKYINDAYGHDAGDKYISKFAEVIKSLEDYGGIVSRRSGDEFLGLLHGNSHSDLIKIINDLKIKINDSSITVGDTIVEKLRVSSGIAWYPDDGDNLNTLINYADFALYEVKYNARGITSYFNKEAYPQINYLAHYSDELDRIIDGEFITFAYQPIIDSKTADILGYEFLMRIFSEIINTPEKLTSLARIQSKLHLVEDTTFKKAFEAYDNNLDLFTGKKIFVNSFTNIILCEKTIKSIVKNRANKLDMLVVELTDFGSVEEEVLTNKLEILKSLKANIAIDNFSEDNNNVLDMNFLPVDYIKIDMSVIDNINIDEEHQKLINDIVLYAQTRKIKTIAVGIKSYEELKYVIDAGVDYLQGFYLAMPSAKPTKISESVIKKIKDLSKR